MRTHRRATDMPEPTPSRRRWRRLGVSHATVVAYLALCVAMSGTAVAATGGTFVLGHRNTADSTSVLTNSAGPALSLGSPAGTPPLKVNRTTKVTNLNADLLDGRDASGFVRLGGANSAARTSLSNPEGVPLRLTSKAGSAPLQVSSTVKVGDLNADLLDGFDASDFVPTTAFDELRADHAALAAQLKDLTAKHAALSAQTKELAGLLAGVSRVQVDGHDTVRFSGVNLQIVNGTGTTAGTPNGRGNLIIGYNAQPFGATSRTGSHYLVVGDFHQWTQYGGVIAGWGNRALGRGASVFGSANTASGEMASVFGGEDNTASGPYSSVAGGGQNTASGSHSSVLGGYRNKATAVELPPGVFCAGSCDYTSVLGGYSNTASGTSSTVSGGSRNTVSSDYGCHPSCS